LLQTVVDRMETVLGVLTLSLAVMLAVRLAQDTTITRHLGAAVVRMRQGLAVAVQAAHTEAQAAQAKTTRCGVVNLLERPTTAEVAEGLDEQGRVLVVSVAEGQVA
jgi:hypothetical protein